MDGRETTRRIRDNATSVLDHDIPVIAMTAHAMEKDRNECLASGMNNCLSKPINPDTLFDVLQKWLPGEKPDNEGSSFLFSRPSRPACCLHSRFSVYSYNSLLKQKKEFPMKKVLIALFLSVACSASPAVTFSTLLKEMTSLEQLTRFPEPAYKTVQFSSYDRRSESPYKSGWYANADGFGREPIPGFVGVAKEPGANGIGTYVMADVKGPGAIVRTWTAAIGGTISVELDGRKLFDGPAKLFLDNPFKALGGEEAGLGQNGFNQREAGYFPVPFSKSCRILWTGDLRHVHFYQIQIRCYEKGAEVETFTPNVFTACKALIKTTSEILADPNRAEAHNVRSETSFSVGVEPGELQPILETKVQEPSAISFFSVKVQAKDIDEALRKTVLRIYCDNSPAPQVETPLGDFFGAGPGICPYHSLPFTVTPDGTMICRFVMPFASSITIEAENWSPADVTLDCAFKISDYSWDESSMHFYANWRVDHNLLAKRANKVIDLPYLCARGKGMFVGAAAILMNPTSIPTPYGGWWGEGDEKIWVDDDTHPSTFGTGSEDYFNYAWSVPDIFTHAYFAQPQTTGPGNRGHVVNNRWHIIDPLPFQSTIFFFMELYPHYPTPGLSYARLSYYYAFDSLRDDRTQVRPALLKIPALPAWLPEAKGGGRNALFLQAEKLQVKSAKGGAAENRPDQMCAGGKLLVWKAAKKENSVAIAIPVPETGTYRIGLTLAHTPASDHALVKLNNEPIYTDNKPIALSTSRLKILRNAHGNRKFKLEKGTHLLTVQSTNSAGDGAAGETGIDFIWLIK